MTRAARRRAWRLGHWAETVCVGDLALRGYRVLARRVRYPVGEIDIVARRGGVLAIIEVKARPSLAEAAESISPRQQQRIRRAAEAFLGTHPGLGGLTVRFDAMLLVPGRWPVHVADAWRA